MSELEWADRKLCDDGACTGVIGADGRCKTCGRAAQFWGDERRRGLRSEEDADRETAAHRLARATPPAEGEVAERRLCPDGACVGLVGDDGRCKVCGTVAPDAPVRSTADAAAAGDDGVGGRFTDPDEDRGGADAPDEDDRQVCPDGACIGLIGGDGRCKVCGRAAGDVPA
ncbi:MAG TPA: hypothetical protein VM734_14320 [Kofleriaceae bacterium]|jgi:hypothetical protein|nr:hypothetical protein [Kofleriaceae bacterium]